MSKTECHVMLDLETLGLMKNPVITKIAAVAFNIMDGSELTGSRFSQLVKVKSCTDVGLKIDGDTIAWWLTQDENALQQHCMAAFSEGISLGSVCSTAINMKTGEELRSALISFTEWMESLKKQYDTWNIFLWGNGAASDIAWLSSAYSACHLQAPWKFHHERDVRTIVHLGKLLGGNDFKKDLMFEGEKHNPIDDCLHQIRYVVKVMTEMKK